MDPKTGIHEQTVTIPIGMDCRELKYRMKDGEPGSFVRCTPKEIEQLIKDDES